MDFNSFLEQNRERIEGFEKDPSGLGAFIDELWRVDNLSSKKTLIVILGLFKLLGYSKFVYHEDDELYVDTGKDLVPFYSPDIEFYDPHRGLPNFSNFDDVKMGLMDESVIEELPEEWFDYLFDNLEIVEDPGV